MMETLFVYGTLHPDRAPEEIADVVRSFRSLGPATVHGHLRNLGEYPGLILDPKAPSVPGQLFAIPADPQLFQRLDAYEDFRPAAPSSSLFLRHQTTATLPDGSQLVTWIYVYNQPVP